METIYADFNNQDEEGRIRLNCVGSLRDVERLRAILQNGFEVRLTDGEGGVVATLVYDPERHLWLAVPDWDTWEEPIPSTSAIGQRQVEPVICAM